jgi:two-component system, response regulator
MNMPDLNTVEVLLVEDNPRDAELTIRALNKRNLGNTLFHVEDGVEALDFLIGRGKYKGNTGGHLPKVVFLDLKLPRVNGLEVLRNIRENERTRAIPVVIVTSSAEDPEIQTAYRLGANSYVIKPVDFDRFLNTMSALGHYWLLVNHPIK